MAINSALDRKKNGLKENINQKVSKSAKIKDDEKRKNRIEQSSKEKEGDKVHVNEAFNQHKG